MKVRQDLSSMIDLSIDASEMPNQSSFKSPSLLMSQFVNYKKIAKEMKDFQDSRYF